jgi:hypothetical protein
VVAWTKESIMNKLHLLAAAALAATGLCAQADEYYGGMYAEPVHSVRSREAVRAELLAPRAQHRELGWRQSRAQLPPREERRSERMAVRQEAAQALRRGEIPSGEGSLRGRSPYAYYRQ